jgi:hypothetical protein
MHISSAISAHLPFFGLGLSMQPLLVRFSRIFARASRALLPGVALASARRRVVVGAFGYDLLVLQAREIRGQ